MAREVTTKKTHNGHQGVVLLHLHGNQLVPLGKQCLLLDGGSEYLLAVHRHNAEWVTETCRQNGSLKPVDTMHNGSLKVKPVDTMQNGSLKPADTVQNGSLKPADRMGH